MKWKRSKGIKSRCFWGLIEFSLNWLFKWGLIHVRRVTDAICWNCTQPDPTVVSLTWRAVFTNALQTELHFSNKIVSHLLFSLKRLHSHAADAPPHLCHAEKKQFKNQLRWRGYAENWLCCLRKVTQTEKLFSAHKRSITRPGVSVFLGRPFTSHGAHMWP